MGWVPEVCTLPTVEQPLRVAEFDRLFAATVRPAERIASSVLRLYLPPGQRLVSAARELVNRETACCSFFSFEMRESPAATELEAVSTAREN